MLTLLALVLGGSALRVWALPARHELWDGDEAGYLISSLSLLEGMTPPFRAAPGGTQIWLGWAYAGTQSAIHFFSGAEERAAPLITRPYAAIEHALFDA